MSRRLLDALLGDGLVSEEKEARGLILAGKVLVNDEPVTKLGATVSDGDIIRVRDVQRFASRGGEKLDAALEKFGIPVAGRNFLDVGSSTGGFTDALLQRGARFVAAVDVGRGLLHRKLVTDVRVQVIEGVDFKDFEPGLLAQKVEAFVADVSFASVAGMIPKAFSLLTNSDRPPEGIVLFKPQFELAKSERALLKRGVLEDKAKSASLLAEFETKLQVLGIKVQQSCEAAIKGRKGNQEFLLHLVKQ